MRTSPLAALGTIVPGRLAAAAVHTATITAYERCAVRIDIMRAYTAWPRAPSFPPRLVPPR